MRGSKQCNTYLDWSKYEYNEDDYYEDFYQDEQDEEELDDRHKRKPYQLITFF